MKNPRESAFALFRSLPLLFKVSWLLIGLGVICMLAGYALRIAGPGWIGITLFLTGYPLGLWPILRSRPSGDAGGLYVTGLVMGTVAATFFLAIQLVIGALLAGVLLMLGRFHGEGAMRVLHFIAMMTSATVLISIPRGARMANAKGG
jgi:ABC-type sugar transport system permease subunit